jgi:hypothetical protein
MAAIKGEIASLEAPHQELVQFGIAGMLKYPFDAAREYVESIEAWLARRIETARNRAQLVAAYEAKALQ